MDPKPHFGVRFVPKMFGGWGGEPLEGAFEVLFTLTSRRAPQEFQDP